jgi:hypothetical protein
MLTLLFVPYKSTNKTYTVSRDDITFEEGNLIDSIYIINFQLDSAKQETRKKISILQAQYSTYKSIENEK